MKYEHILIRFGELNTKGKNKKDFIIALFHNIKKVLKKFEKLEFLRAHDRIYIHLNGEDENEVIKILKEVSGIANMSLVTKTSKDITSIINVALDLALQQEVGTFKVKTTRSDKSFPYHSDEINRSVANEILNNTKHHVDVHNPDFYVKIEIRNEGAFIFSNVIKGAGGYPLGVGGKALALISGGIDSPVAIYLMMKRGVNIEAIHFASPPYTSQNAKQKVIDLLRIISNIKGGAITLHIVPFTKLQEAIYDMGDESYAITIMRRMMYRIAEGVAIKRKCLALVSGESIGQVASQTLNSMLVINNVISLPMIRPLATMDKNEIIEISKRINTYDISIRPYIDCCTIFNPVNPIIKPTLYRAEELEKRFNYEDLLQECIENIETLYIDSSLDNQFL
ncbi:MAG: tRNA uracil 4-sulfurtransferase ThiI [Bacilli bacterium]|nr:tRNA 4-thiouridine(8) synthase ThiI [Bacilli bacterium]